MITHLTENEAWALLEKGRLAHLGCIAAGEPYVVPVNYLLVADSAYLHSLPGQKIDALRAHPRACLQVDDITEDWDWHSVIAHGQFEEITDPRERVEILRAFYTKFPLLTVVESAIAQDAEAPPVIVYRIRIDKLSAVAESNSSESTFAHTISLYRTIKRRAEQAEAEAKRAGATPESD